MKNIEDQSGTPIYLNIIWHQHQPSYIDPVRDRLIAPWVRTHGTKDYYDMAAILKEYPDIHVTVNLTSSMLLQLEEYYVNRLKPYFQKSKNRIDAARYLKEAAGSTDPWIDLALKQTSRFNGKDRGYLYRNPWNAFGISEVQISRFPEYERLRNYFTTELRKGNEPFTYQDMREVKFWFYLAHFDPDFLDGPVILPDGSTCDLSDIVERHLDDAYYLRRRVTEDDCNRMIAETYKVLANIIPIHRELIYEFESAAGQIEVITTPFYHPILPLVFDSELARVSQPRDPLPSKYSYPDDAQAQVARAVKYFTDTFGKFPKGMWPAEGSVAHEIIPVFREFGIEWIATDQRILQNSRPRYPDHLNAYRALCADDGAWRDDPGLAIVFRDTDLSDRIGFVYQNFRGEDAAEDFIRRVLSYRQGPDGSPRVLTVILDGENAWEWYRYDIDGKEFLHSLYRKLTEHQRAGRIVTITMSEYIHGNDSRGIPAHPVHAMKTIQYLYPGSWIHANFDTWIGEEEENNAWQLLLRARKDIIKLGIPRPDPMAHKPKEGTTEWYEYMAWESIYAAEGSDWFWWFGDDQIAPGGDQPWDEGFRTHLTNMYRFARKAGYDTDIPEFPSVLVARTRPQPQPFEHIGTMARSTTATIHVRFVVDARHVEVTDAVYIVGNAPELGLWTPNRIRMFDDGTHGDDIAGDGIWSIELDLPRGMDIHYKYTNSGFPGEWTPGEEFPGTDRTIFVDGINSELIIVKDIFGQLL
jgi:alpha-amylase/alpha-mannosidase (GH57 family)